MANLRTAPQALAHLLDLPEGVEITDVRWDSNQGHIVFSVHGDVTTDDGPRTLEEGDELTGVWETTEEIPGIRLIGFQDL